VISGTGVAWNYIPGTISSSTGTFDLISAYVTAAYVDETVRCRVYWVRSEDILYVLSVSKYVRPVNPCTSTVSFV